MKRVNISIKEDVDLKFKKKASQKFMFERGWYSRAMNEAMESWLKKSKTMSIEEFTQNFPREMGGFLWETIKKEANLDKSKPNEYIDILIESVYGDNSQITYKIVNDEVTFFFSDKYENNPEYHLSRMFLLINLVRAALEDYKGIKCNIRGLEHINNITITSD
jgi:hypothetical protein